jgi:hypothetical protein
MGAARDRAELLSNMGEGVPLLGVQVREPAAVLLGCGAGALGVGRWQPRPYELHLSIDAAAATQPRRAQPRRRHDPAHARRCTTRRARCCGSARSWRRRRATSTTCWRRRSR